MQATLINLSELKVVGLGTKFISILSPDKTNMLAIPQLWDQFIKILNQIPDRINIATTFGIVEHLSKIDQSRPDELFYIAAAEVSDFTSVPAHMLQRTIPAGQYASFTHKGKLNALEKTMKVIYTSWLPTSKIQLRNAPHLEIYDQRFNPASDLSEFDILLPIS